MALLGLCIVLALVVETASGLIISAAGMFFVCGTLALWVRKMKRLESQVGELIDNPDCIPPHIYRKGQPLLQRLYTALSFLSDRTQYQHRKSEQQQKEIDYLKKEIKNIGSLLDQVSYFDLNSGIINRSHFERELNKEILRAAREGMPLSLLLIKFENYRECVHAAGESLAKEYFSSIANMLLRIVRISDLVFRYEDDTFALILPATGRKTAQLVCNRLRSAIMAIHLSAENDFAPRPELVYSVATNAVKDPTAKKLTAIAKQIIDKTRRKPKSQSAG